MNGKRLLKSVLLLITVLMMTLNAQAAVKTVKNTLYGELSSREKKNAVLVKNGKSTIRVSEDGYLKFKAPYCC